MMSAFELTSWERLGDGSVTAEPSIWCVENPKLFVYGSEAGQLAAPVECGATTARPSATRSERRKTAASCGFGKGGLVAQTLSAGDAVRSPVNMGVYDCPGRSG